MFLDIYLHVKELSKHLIKSFRKKIKAIIIKRKNTFTATLFS